MFSVKHMLFPKVFGCGCICPIFCTILNFLPFELLLPFQFQCDKNASFCRSPSVSRIRAKMLYATSKDRFRRELEGIHYEIQATDPTEMELEVLQERAH